MKITPHCTGLTRLVTSVHLYVYDKVLCNCGHRHLHRLSTSAPRWWTQLFDVGVHSVDELAQTSSPVIANEACQHNLCGRWPWKQETCCLCTAPSETGVIFQPSAALRCHDREGGCTSISAQNSGVQPLRGNTNSTRRVEHKSKHAETVKGPARSPSSQNAPL